MNANELADYLDFKSDIVFPHQDDIVNMLRQQQAEIEALKNRNWELVSEPWGFDRHQAKTLTDEEIMKCVKQFTYAKYYDDFFKFAKKLLKKAQEK